MFHDLILALNGFTGDLFYLDGQDIKIRVDLQIPLFHSSELLVLDDVLEIASLYKILNDFVDQRRVIKLKLKSTDQPSGVYVSSVCNGITSILDMYTDTVADLESKILEDPHITLNHIRVELEPFRGIFRVLKQLTSTVNMEQRSTCTIVEIVKSEVDGNIHLQEYLQKLIPWVNKTLYRHITNWVVYGTLEDPFGEFFIQKENLANNLETDTNSDTKQPQTPALTGKRRQRSGSNKLSASKLNNADYWTDYSLVPSHLNNSLVERILFIGKAVSILENFEKTKGNLLKKQEEFYERMTKLPLDTFRTEDLCETIEDLAVSIGKDLHHVVVVEANLSKHIGLVKDFYLTGRGELFHDFLASLLDKSDENMCSNKVDLKHVFKLSAIRVQLPDDIFQRVHIKFSPEPLAKESLDSYISNIALSLELEWPLHVLFSEESLKEYNQLFAFLLKIRLIQIALNSIWTSTRKVFRFPVPNGPAELKIVMSHFIDHLQHYLQADVLESQYSLLKTEFEKSVNFEHIREAHIRFLRNISSQSFQNQPRIKKFLDDLMKICFDFVKFMRTHLSHCEKNDLPINEGITSEIKQFKFDFHKTLSLLFDLFKGLKSNPVSGNCLTQFLLILNYNDYFSTRY